MRLAQAEQLGNMFHQHQHLASMAQLYQSRLASSAHVSRRHAAQSHVSQMSHVSQYTLDKVAEPGNTLLWDLIQVKLSD